MVVDHIATIRVIDHASAGMQRAVAALWGMMTPYERAKSHLRPVVDAMNRPLPGQDYCERLRDHYRDCLVMSPGVRKAVHSWIQRTRPLE